MCSVIEEGLQVYLGKFNIRISNWVKSIRALRNTTTPKGLFILSGVLMLFALFLAFAAGTHITIGMVIAIMYAAVSFQLYALSVHFKNNLRDFKTTLEEGRFRQSKKMNADLLATRILFARFPVSYFPVTSYSMIPANLSLLVSLLDTFRPTKIVELGCGLTTILLAAWLRENESGSLLSIEHDEDWASVCQRSIETNGLSEYVTLYHAPLVSAQEDSDQCSWYDLALCDSLPDSVDCLVVDGPPAGKNADARYPAMEMFYPRLSSGGFVVLDDGVRKGEQEIVSKWLEVWPDLQVQYLPSLTGLFILRRS